ncbi:hypothetical protein [Pseudoalteromonas ruthenica]|uniref:hypothetical protein n=1 Tax=Pseudoalteromonas ruthenica TaxID=151081 RepID=UPI00241C0DC1|nr:hypothetical protein [Pseudoalteromonas ruthenica]
MILSGCFSNHRPSICVLATISLLTLGCASTPELPHGNYSKQAQLLVTIAQCEEQSLLSEAELKAGQFVIDYSLSQFKTDVKRINKERSDEFERMKNRKVSKSVCKEVRKSIYTEILKIKEYEDNKKAIAEQIAGVVTNSVRGTSLNTWSKNQVPTLPVIMTPMEPMHSQPTVQPIKPSGYDRNYIPNPQPGTLTSSVQQGGARVCKYSGGQTISIAANRTCPLVLK